MKPRRTFQSLLLFALLTVVGGFSAIAQTNNHIVSMVEEAVIECYDTLLTHQVSGGATWKYIFSEERREWVCIQKRFREI